jgi:hypothetical protein
VTSTLRPLVGASGSSTSASTPDSDSADDYPEIEASACGEPMKDSCFIYMVAPNGDRSSIHGLAWLDPCRTLHNLVVGIIREDSEITHLEPLLHLLLELLNRSIAGVGDD